MLITILLAIAITASIIFFSEHIKLEKTIEQKQTNDDVNKKELVVRYYKNPSNIVPINTTSKPTRSHDILVRNEKYIPRINGKYLREIYFSGQFVFETFDYCIKCDYEKEAIETIKNYYQYKDIDPIIYDTPYKNSDIIYYPVSKLFYPRIKGSYIYLPPFHLYEKYELQDNAINTVHFSEKAPALKVIEKYHNNLGLNDKIITVDLELQ